MCQATGTGFLRALKELLIAAFPDDLEMRRFAIDAVHGVMLPAQKGGLFNGPTLPVIIQRFCAACAALRSARHFWSASYVKWLTAGTRPYFTSTSTTLLRPLWFISASSLLTAK